MWSPKKNNAATCCAGNGHCRQVNGTNTDTAIPPRGPIPIAVVGMACRFPGNITRPSKLWDLYYAAESSAGVDSNSPPPSPPTPTISDGSSSGFDSACYPNGSGDSSPPGEKNDADLNYFPKEVRREDDESLFFNGSFLGVSAEVLNALQPETRTLVKTVYEATENAGIPIDSLAGSTTSVFTGFHGKNSECPDSHSNGTEESTTTGREKSESAISGVQLSSSISHLYDLRGPSMSIDTGCSSSLVSLHQACETIRSGESRLSIVGAVSSKPTTYSEPSSSAAVLVLKGLDHALRDGDRVHSVIKATGLNQNGRRSELGSPAVDPQVQLIRGVYQRAGLDPHETGYIEAQLSGKHDETDRLEARVLTEVFDKARKTDSPTVKVSSVATDIGRDQLGPVQGLAAIIKASFAMKNKQIPSGASLLPNHPLEREDTSSFLQFTTTDLLVTPWPENRPLRTSIHNVGCGGTNSHVILEAAPPTQVSSPPHVNGISTEDQELSSRVFILSAEDANTTRTMAKNLAAHLRNTTKEGGTNPISPADLAYTLAERRSRLSHKVAIRAGSLDELIESLDRLDQLKIRAPPTSTDPKRSRRLGFVFNGQGAQWHAMGRELLTTYPVFASAIKEADSVLRGFGADWSLEEELTRDAESTRVSEINISQPSTVALQLALVNLLRSWNIHPSAVVSHSTGEFAAAYAAGALSFSQALGIVYHLGDLARKYYGDDDSQRGGAVGGMAAAAISAKDVEKYLAHTPTSGGRVVVACINSPKSVTLSGDTAALDGVLKRLDDDGVFARKLKVPLAYHSHHMSAFEAEYIERLRPLFGPPSSSSQPKSTPATGAKEVIYVSPVTGAVVASPQEVLTPEYYVRNITSPVLFSDAFEAFSGHIDQVVEIGPHSTLSGPIREILRESLGRESDDPDVGYATCLKRSVDAVQTMQDLACELLVLGYPVSLRDVNKLGTKGQPHKFVPDLPSYPWSGPTPEAVEPTAEIEESESDEVVATRSKLVWELDVLHNIPTQIKDSLRITLDQDEADTEKTLARASYYLISDALTVLRKQNQEDPKPWEAHHQKELLDWMVSTVEQQKQGGFGPGSALWSRATPGMRQLLYDELNQGKYGVAGELIAQVGSKLVAIGRGQITPEQLAKNTSKLLHRYHTEVPRLKSRTYKQLSRAAEWFALKNPGAKVLEIGGASAGGVTRAVLDGFSSRGGSRGGTLLGQYVFTAAKPDSVEAARRNLATWELDDDSLIEFHNLDIEQDPVATTIPTTTADQSAPIALGTFDLVVASLTLDGSQSRDLARKLLQAKRMLKPGGKIFLVGTTRERLDVQLLSRALSNERSTILSIDQWDQTLRDSGFTGVDFEIADCEQERHQSSSFIISTLAPALSSTPSVSVSVIYTAPVPESWYEQLAGAIREKIPGISSVVAESWDTFEPLAAVDAGKIYIFTGDLAGKFEDELDEASFTKLQRFVAGGKVLWLSQSGVVDSAQADLTTHATTCELLHSLRGQIDGSRSFYHLDFEHNADKGDPWTSDKIDHIVHVLQTVRNTVDDNVIPAQDLDREYAVQNGLLHVPRILPVEEDSDASREGEEVLNGTPAAEIKQLLANPDATFLVVGGGDGESGISGAGEEVASWLVEQGAQNLLVVSSNTPDNSRVDAFVKRGEAEGRNIQVRGCDVSSESSFVALLKGVETDNSIPPIRGVVVVDDAIPQDPDSQITPASFERRKQAISRRLAGLQNLDNHLPGELSFFVLLSLNSYAPGRSSATVVPTIVGTFQDVFIRRRIAAGRPVVSVSVVDGVSINGDDATSTTTPVSISNVLDSVLGNLAVRHSPETTPEDAQIIVGLPRWDKLPAEDPIAKDPRFGTLRLGIRRKRRTALSASEAARQALTPADLLLQALEARDGSAGEEDKETEGIAQALQAQLAVLLRIQAAEIDPAQPVATYGVDSIVAIEVRSWLADTTDGKVKISVLEISNSDSLYHVAKMVRSRARKE